MKNKNLIIIRVIFLILVLLIAQGCASKRQKQYPINSEYQDFFIINENKIPLPEGTWKVVNHEPNRSYFIMWFIESNIEKPQRFIRVAVNTTYNFYFYDQNPEFTNPENYLYSEIRENTSGGAHDAWKINKITKMKLKKFGQPQPLYMSFFHFTSVMEQSRLLSVSYFTTPKPFGLTGADQDKLVKILIKEGKEIHKQLKNTF